MNLRRQRLAARLSQMVTAKPLGQLNKAGVMASFVTLARHNSKSTPIFLYVFSADPQRLLLLLIYILASVLTLWTRGNCLGWGPSDRSVFAGTEYHRT